MTTLTTMKISMKIMRFEEVHVVFPSDSLEVYVQETNIHEHILNPEYFDKAAVYIWTKAATETILTGIKNNARPKVILRNMRDNGCFINCPEPTSQQLSNKIAYMKKINGLTEGMENTHEMRQKIEQHDTEPDNDLEAYIPYSEIHDEDKDEETKFIVIFATKRTLSFLNQGDTLHIDATYRLVYILKLFS